MPRINFFIYKHGLLGEWASAGSKGTTDADKGSGNAPWAPTGPDTRPQPAAGAAERRRGANAIIPEHFAFQN